MVDTHITFFIKHWITSTFSPAFARQTKSCVCMCYVSYHYLVISVLLREKFDSIIIYMYKIMLSRL